MLNDTVANLVRVHKRYGSVTALDGVEIELKAGEVLAVLGANGAGKTTAISLLLGLIVPDEGEATLLGCPPRSPTARRNIGAMLQASGVPDTLRVDELLSLFASYYIEPYSIVELAALTGIEAILKRRYGKLSGGQQRCVQFALALVGWPRVLFLDEPTVGLDVEARQAVWSTIRAHVRNGCSVLLTTHYLEEAEALADRVIVLANGRVVANDSVDALRMQHGQRLIQCRSGFAPERIAAWPNVVDVHRGDDGRLRLKTSAPEAVLRQLLTEDAEVSDLEVGRAGLAETFMALTREAA